jgi:hypothetical protein
MLPGLVKQCHEISFGPSTTMLSATKGWSAASAVAESSAHELPTKHRQWHGRWLLFRQSAVLQGSNTPGPHRYAKRCGRATLRVPGFEDSDSTELAEVLSDEAKAL